MHGGAPHLVSGVDNGAKRVNRPIASAEKLSMCRFGRCEARRRCGGRRAGDVLDVLGAMKKKEERNTLV